jgi:DNA-binding MarR family transcriptional regulator
MLEQSFSKVYNKFKLQFYENVFHKIQNRNLTLTAVETFCIEIIYALDHPTISEFASFLQISPPNAAYKVNSLIKKGYLKKVQSTQDKREFHLEVTGKYMEYYNLSFSYMNTVMKRIEERFSDNELQILENILNVTANELMPEVDQKKAETLQDVSAQ